MARLGAHLSTAGGAFKAAAAAVSAGCESLQIFLRAPGRWTATDLSDDAVARFRSAAAAAGLVGRCFAHAPYLLNLASSDDGLRERSVAVLVEELQRAGRLGLAGVVLHPGSAGTGPRADALARCRDAVARAVATAGDGAGRLLLEGTAGAGGHLGTSPAELALLAGRPDTGRVGICLDTAHLWAVGYDLSGDGWARVLGEVAEHWGVAAPDLLHGNDTRVERGSRRDRHAEPGAGLLGVEFFRRLLDDPRLAELPIVLEIPPGPDNAHVRRVLTALGAGRGPASS